MGRQLQRWLEHQVSGYYAILCHSIHLPNTSFFTAHLPDHSFYPFLNNLPFPPKSYLFHLSAVFYLKVSIPLCAASTHDDELAPISPSPTSLYIFQRLSRMHSYKYSHSWAQVLVTKNQYSYSYKYLATSILVHKYLYSRVYKYSRVLVTDEYLQVLVSIFSL